MKKRYKHNLSNYHNMTIAMGPFSPMDIKECLGGDTIEGHSEAIIRFMPMVGPTMHPVRAKIIHGFVPTRLIWSDFEAFITNGTYGSTPPVHPTITLTAANAGVGSLADTLGIPPLSGGDTKAVSALPFRAYQKFVIDWLMDQDLDTAPALSTASGADVTTSTLGWNSSWKKDYLTTARPWPQKGASVPIPTSSTDDTLDVTRKSNAAAVKLLKSGTNTQAAAGALAGSVSGSDTYLANADTLSIDPNGTLEVDLSAGMGTIDDLNMSVALQRFLRNRAKWGSRLTEYLKQFGVRAQDARLQRSELISQGVATVQFSEVLQTAEGTDGVGTMKGHGVGGLGSNKFRYYCQEPGFFFTLISVMPEPFYTYTTEKFWHKATFEDYFQKEFLRTGQQPIYQEEVQINAASPKTVWGYNDPYDDYRFSYNRVSGLMRTTYKDWHVAREGTPTLNSAFIRGLPDDRIFQSSAPDSIQVFGYNKVHMRRVVPRTTPQAVL